ncbi:hypothetical protein XPR_2350 [Xanthomonas arboricola pv. pruni MAFF 301420]|uniref:Uncharacterized protein n=3 Tax=Xanthomonas arboricola TaxID=56448 RepID=W4SGJ5_9XANT|nr:hypothetical protein XPU_0309 [Xanthomonas arboricola pv. pruni str. MAFF 311562]GAE55715.1 hypothetical protein XPR_2350 [Xanthomonas arboricola pv. pruni MAFF 301420]GAE58107.1 hypothetical protein XPN_0013 [Xanthomonas arboricola pv. pruni MAFF 301427]
MRVQMHAHGVGERDTKWNHWRASGSLTAALRCGGAAWSLFPGTRGYNDSAVSVPKSCAADALALPCNASATNHLRQRPTRLLHVGQAGAMFDIGMYHPYLPVSSAASTPARVLAAMQLL